MVTGSTSGKFPLTRRSDGRWQKKFRGKTYYFTGTPEEALAQWERLRESLTPAELNHATDLQGVRWIPVSEILPAPENDDIYDPIDSDDPNFRSLVTDVGRRGILQPLTVTSDSPFRYIGSGHRRFAAALENGLTEVPCLIDPIRREDDLDAFVRFLISHNEQRVKTIAHKLREEAAKLDPQEAYQRVLTERAERSRIQVQKMDLGEKKVRSKINRKLRRELLESVNDLFTWIKKPTSDRKIHYHLATMANPPLKNTNRTDSTYGLDDPSYDTLTRFLTQARMEGIIPWEWITDETRPVTTWNVWGDPATFIREHLDRFLRGYYRDLLQSQPNYTEVLAEKNTVASQIKEICANYCLPMTSGRGFCSSKPRYDLAQRYLKSGKDQLVLLIISDLDPAGMYIAESFAQSMRDDFGIEKIHAVKVAVTGEQVEEYKLPKGPTVKKDDRRREAFIERHGEHVFEVEALPDGELEKLLDDAIRSVLDLEAYNHEVAQEARDAAEIEAARRSARWALRGLSIGDGE